MEGEAKVQMMTQQHIEKRMKAAPYLLEAPEEVILFCDESYFDTRCPSKFAYQRDGEPQQQRQEERYVSKVLVWGIGLTSRC